MKTRVFIGIGSNIGDRVRNCLSALECIDRVPDCRVVAKSDLYLTQPVGVPEDQDWYVNGAAILSTDIPAPRLLRSLLDIEEEMGRVREKKKGSRIIDLDILLYGQQIINKGDITVPHPLLHLRRFVLVPLVELAPDLVHPVLGKPMAYLLRSMESFGQSVVPIGEV